MVVWTLQLASREGGSMISSAVTVLDLSSRHGRRFLARVASGKEGWRMVALPRNDWRIAFIREVGVDASSEIVTSERVSIERPYRDADCGSIPVDVAGAWLILDDAKTAAMLLSQGWRFKIRHHEGSEIARELSHHVVEFVAIPPQGGRGLAIGGVTIIDVELKRTIIGGAVSTSNLR